MAGTMMRIIEVATDDGCCPVHLHAPSGAGAWPGVLLYLDAPGMRPAIDEIAARLAGHGFAVAVPDLFYRAGPYAPIDPRVVWADPALREAHRRRLPASMSPELAMRDTAAILARLDDVPEVLPGRLGLVGYCMGGRLALLAAGTFPQRFAAAASFHGGGLADDRPSSPHLLAGRIDARIYVAGATDDPHFDAAMRDRLDAALTAAGVDHLIETYPALHGWVPRDMPTHDPAEAEHHWRALVPFLTEALGTPR